VGKELKWEPHAFGGLRQVAF